MVEKLKYVIITWGMVNLPLRGIYIYIYRCIYICIYTPRIYIYIWIYIYTYIWHHFFNFPILSILTMAPGPGHHVAVFISGTCVPKEAMSLFTTCIARWKRFLNDGRKQVDLLKHLETFVQVWREVTPRAAVLSTRWVRQFSWRGLNHLHWTSGRSGGSPFCNPRNVSRKKLCVGYWQAGKCVITTWTYWMTTCMRQSTSI